MARQKRGETSPGEMGVFARREQVAKLYVTGKKQREIAEQLSVSEATISEDLRQIREGWKESSTMDFDERIAQELATVDEIEKEAWDSWGRSKSKAANAKFLELVMSCVSKRCRILGLYAPEKFAPTDPTGTRPWEPRIDPTVQALLDDAREALRRHGQADEGKPLPELPQGQEAE